jgi:hypothetical protein
MPICPAAITTDTVINAHTIDVVDQESDERLIEMAAQQDLSKRRTGGAVSDPEQEQDERGGEKARQERDSRCTECSQVPPVSEVHVGQHNGVPQCAPSHIRTVG